MRASEMSFFRSSNHIVSHSLMVDAPLFTTPVCPIDNAGDATWTGAHPGIEDELELRHTPSLPPVSTLHDCPGGQKLRSSCPSDTITLKPLLRGDARVSLPTLKQRTRPSWLPYWKKCVRGTNRGRNLEHRRKLLILLFLVLGLVISVSGILMGVFLLAWAPHHFEGK